MILQIKNLNKNFGTNVIFEDTDLILNEGDKLAVVGQNGKGKSTLIRCIAGDEDFQGTISIKPGTKLAVMEQQKSFDEVTTTFAEYLSQKKEIIQNKINSLEVEMGTPEVYENERRYNTLLSEHELLCCRQTEDIVESNLKKNLELLSFPLDLIDQPISSLSGGEKTALRLSECLAKEADLLILDEPTNHLDFKAIDWLEKWLRESGKTAIIITHDRYFLDRVVNKVAEVESKKLEVYNKDYTGYLQDRVSHRIVMQKQHDANTKEKKRLLESAQEKRIWASKNGNKSMRMQADNLQRRAEELPDIENPNELEDKYKFECKEGERSSSIIFNVENVSKSYDEKKILDNINLTIERKQRISIVGRNGTGKSTLLKILSKQETPDSGTVSEGTNLKIGYFDQENANLNPKDKVGDYLGALYAHLHDAQIVSAAKKFGFDHDLPKKKISALSGGEKARIQLLKLMLGGFNVLLLDEPTNHLDLELREALESAILNWKGTVIFVSHDRFFMDKIATHTLKLEDGKILLVNGNYTANFG